MGNKFTKGKISKIIFLDIDGVLNNAKSDISELFIIENELLEILEMIIEQSGAIVVLSSTWRLYSGTRNKFSNISKLKYGEHWISCTPNFGTNRVDEILWWLKENSDFDGPNNEEFNSLTIECSKSQNDFPLELIKLQKKLSKVTFVAIDDMDFTKEGNNFPHMKNNFIHVNKKSGITFEDAQKAIEILNKIQ